MTRDEVLALEGRELDAAIAEDVMGQTVVFAIKPWVGLESGVFSDQAYRIWTRSYPSGAAPRRLPRYSSDIAAAWQVAEKMVASQVGEFRLIHRQTFGSESQYAAGFALAPCGEPEYVVAPTAPLAISRAAILAHLEAKAHA